VTDHSRFARPAFCAAALLALAGCLLPTPPPPPRYFAPEASTSERPLTAPPAPAALRVGPVRSPLHLREPMTWRRSDVEYGFYEQRRWTELPATYVERALERELGPGSSATPNGPVVVADVRAFEEVLAPGHEARVAVAIELVEGRCVRLRRTFSAARPLTGDDPAAVARGIGEALDEVARAVATAVGEALTPRAPCGV